MWRCTIWRPQWSVFREAKEKPENFNVKPELVRWQYTCQVTYEFFNPFYYNWVSCTSFVLLLKSFHPRSAEMYTLFLLKLFFFLNSFDQIYAFRITGNTYICVFFIPIWDPGTSSNPASFVVANRMLSLSLLGKDACPASENKCEKA